MLGWVLNRNATAAGASSADDSQFEQPDTPAPVFAARALKTALFGTPAPPSEDDSNGSMPHAQQSDGVTAAKADLRSPSQPQGILLTPGTATARRKRVSFGNDVKDNLVKAGGMNIAEADRSQSRPKTRLAEALEKSRRKKDGSMGANAGLTKPGSTDSRQPNLLHDEVDQDGPETDPDVTVDLNEPRSGSGKYWKSSFETYHAEAKVEMEKLVKYKQLAKSYAKMKDAESLQLNQRLKDEQQKVSQMEKKVTELAKEILLKKKATTGGVFDKDLMDKLTRQTALTSQYQAQVKELETLLAEPEQAGNGTLEDGGGYRRRTASPRTQRTLLETQRELRRARASVKELAALREEISRLGSKASTTEQRLAEVTEENSKLSHDLRESKRKTRDLELQLSTAELEVLRRNNELGKLRMEYETLKGSAKARFVEAEEVVRKKNEKIEGLKKENTSLRHPAMLEEQPCEEKLRELSTQLQTEPGKRQQTRTASSERMLQLESARIASTKRLKDAAIPLQTCPTMSNCRNKENQRASSASLRLDAAQNPQATTTSRAESSKLHEHDTRREQSAVLSNRVNLAEPRPVSAERPHQQLGPARARHNKATLSELPVPRSTTPLDDTPRLDLASHRFDRLGGIATTTNDSSAVWNMANSKVDLPPDRRAAALVRLERKKADRMKAQRTTVRDKENIAP